LLRSSAERVKLRSDMIQEVLQETNVNPPAALVVAREPGLCQERKEALQPQAGLRSGEAGIVPGSVCRTLSEGKLSRLACRRGCGAGLTSPHGGDRVGQDAPSTIDGFV